MHSWDHCGPSVALARADGDGALVDPGVGLGGEGGVDGGVLLVRIFLRP